MAQTQDKPSTLAKLLGFYSIEVKNLETGNVESKADVLVMENLFWNHKPDAVYDLKGIRGRKAKSDSPQRTLMDVDFMESKSIILENGHKARALTIWIQTNVKPPHMSDLAQNMFFKKRSLPMPSFWLPVMLWIIRELILCYVTTGSF